MLGPELVVNGGFDDASGWTLSGSPLIFDGLATFSGVGSEIVYRNVGMVLGKTYQVSYDLVALTLGLFNIGVGGSSPRTASKGQTGSYSQEVLSSGPFVYCYGVITDASIDNVSIREVIPTWYDTEIDGTPIQPSISIPTRSGTKKWYQEPFANPFGYSNWPARTNKVTCRKFNPVDTTNFVPFDETITVTVVDDVAAIASAGLQGVCTTGKVYELTSVTSQIVNISGPTGNTNQHSYSAYIRVVSGGGGGYVALSGAGGGVGPSEMITSSAYTKAISSIAAPSSTAVMRIYCSVGTTLRVILPQLEEGAFATPPIFDPLNDSLTSITRAATNLTLPTAGVLPVNDFGQLLEWIPGATGQTGVLWSTRVDATNYTQISCTPTQILFTKVISGVTTTVTATYTHTVNVPVCIQSHQDSALGMSLRVQQQGGEWSAYATDPSVSAQPVGTTYQVGAGNNATHSAGYFPNDMLVTGNLAKLETEVAKVS
jgi:hypothetical protein